MRVATAGGYAAADAAAVADSRSVDLRKAADRDREVAVPAPRSDRALTTIGGPDATVAALVHDAAWSDDPAFIEAVRACVLTLIERGNPHGSPVFPLADVEAARARLLSELDGERRRLERDLHDGAQQRLVGLRIRLGLALDPAAGGPRTDATLLEQLGGEVDEIIDDIRSLARGIYPSLLVDRGLHDALVSAALRMPVPTHVDAHGIARYDDAVEAAVYFTCLEALQNAAKHASGATAITITLRDDVGALRFEICDDGAGFDPDTTARRGLGHMHDRTSGVGGTLTIESSPGSGTRIAGTVPLVERPSAPSERARAFATRPPLDDTAILRHRA